MCEEQLFSITQFQDTLVSGMCAELGSPHATQTLFANIGRAVSFARGLDAKPFGSIEILQEVFVGCHSYKC